MHTKIATTHTQWTRQKGKLRIKIQILKGVGNLASSTTTDGKLFHNSTAKETFLTKVGKNSWNKKGGWCYVHNNLLHLWSSEKHLINKEENNCVQTWILDLLYDSVDIQST